MQQENTTANTVSPEQKFLYKIEDINTAFLAYEDLQRQIDMWEYILDEINALPANTPFLRIRADGTRSISGKFIVGDRDYTDEFFGDDNELMFEHTINTSLIQAKIDNYKLLQNNSFVKLQSLVPTI